MADKKQDVRVTKTQRSLVLALLALLENQSFAKITINDICNEAMVSRSTFYAHFEDKYRLLQFSLQEVDRRIFVAANGKTLREALFDILSKMQIDAKLLRNLMIAELDIEVIELFQQHFMVFFKQKLQEKAPENGLSEPKLEVIASFYASGISQTVALWIAKRLPISTEEMADTLCELLQWPENR